MRSSAATIDLRQINADFGGPLNDAGTLRYRFVALGKESDTQVEHAEEERALLAPSEFAHA